MEPEFSNSGAKTTQRKILHPASLFYGFVIFSVLFTIIFYFLILPIHLKVQEELELKNNEVTEMSEEISNLSNEITELEIKLHASKESLVTLEREITKSQGQEDGENLINDNSVFRTLSSVVLRAEANPTSETFFEVDADVRGEIIEGPLLVGDEIWWKVLMKGGAEGWVDESYLERLPSVVLEIDSDRDGVYDTKIRFIGDYDTDGFVFEPAESGTYIKYKGEKIEPYDITKF